MTDEKKIKMTAGKGAPVGFFVLEETRIGGTDYLLVTDEMDDEDGECYILKDLSGAEDDQAVYEFVENDEELDYLYRIFSELLNDADVEIEK